MKTKLFILLIGIAIVGNIFGQKDNLSQEEIDSYIKTSYILIDLIKKEDLTGVWFYNHWKNQDTTNIRNFINSANGLIDKYGLPNKEKIKVNTTYSKREGVDDVPIIDMIEISFPMEESIEDVDAINFLFTRSIGPSRVISNSCHIKTTYQDFLDFEKKMKESGRINTNDE